MDIIIGSARVDERGAFQGGAPGDQKQKTSKNDRVGEVSRQKFYVHSKGWYILRAKSEEHRSKLADAMITACDNSNIGYSQSARLEVVKNGIKTTKPTNADCSSLVRACIIAATGKDVGNFTTYNEAKILESSGLFNTRTKFVSLDKTPLCEGDVLVTCKKGHTVIVTDASESDKTEKETKPVETKKEYYPKYTGDSVSIVVALKAVGETNTKFIHRLAIAEVNGITNYEGSASQNTRLVTLIKKGELIKA